VCEEVWSWWQEGSVHRAPWPDAQGLAAMAAAGTRDGAGDGAGAGDAGAGDAGAGEELALELAAEVLREVRKAKSQAKRPMRWPVTRVLVRDTPERLRALALGEDDLLQAGSIERLETEADDGPDDGPSVAVELARIGSGE
jgi:valyl-tRNA synthetase